jgi:hypothetical protein
MSGCGRAGGRLAAGAASITCRAVFRDAVIALACMVHMVRAAF